MTAPRLAAILLATAAYLFAGAWHLQWSAANDFESARKLQATEVTAPDRPPPDLDDYRRILASLERAIGVRRAIETQLQSIEASVAALEGSQTIAHETSGSAAEELDLLSAALARAAGAASSSETRLGGLNARLRTSATLARAIAEELEELDRRMGPSAGGDR